MKTSLVIENPADVFLPLLILEQMDHQSKRANTGGLGRGYIHSMSKKPGYWRLHDLGIDIMKRDMSVNYATFKTEFKAQWDKDYIDRVIEKEFPGEGWRVPTGRELRLICSLAELGLDLMIVEKDHFNYIRPVWSTEDMTFLGRPSKMCAICTWYQDPKTKKIGVKTRYVNSESASVPNHQAYVRLVRDIK